MRDESTDYFALPSIEIHCCAGIASAAMGACVHDEASGNGTHCHLAEAVPANGNTQQDIFATDN